MLLLSVLGVMNECSPFRNTYGGALVLGVAPLPLATRYASGAALPPEA